LHHSLKFVAHDFEPVASEILGVLIEPGRYEVKEEQTCHDEASKLDFRVYLFVILLSVEIKALAHHCKNHHGGREASHHDT